MRGKTGFARRVKSLVTINPFSFAWEPLESVFNIAVLESATGRGRGKALYAGL